MSERSRVRWLCRRGMKELDVLLERFVAADYEGLTETQVQALIELLNHEDPDLYYLVMQRQAPANDVQAELLERIRQFERPVGL